MYIENLELRDYRCFENTRITFQYKEKGASSTAPPLPNINLILGNNGTGKTAMLRALTLAVLGTVAQGGSGWRMYFEVRRPPGNSNPRTTETPRTAFLQAKIQLHSQDATLSPETHARWGNELIGSTTGQTKIEWRQSSEKIINTARVNFARWEPLFNDFSPAFFMAGYGAVRRNGAPETYDPNTIEKARSRRYQRVAGLFEESTILVPMQLWWKTMRDQERIEEAVTMLNRVLPDEVSIEVFLNPQHGELDFGLINSDALHITRLPFEVLSDGYRTFIGLMADLQYHLAQVAPSDKKLADLHGVVLIDEIDLFLHPRWQRLIADHLAETFPNLQFFITTHSPILAGTLHYQNIVIAEPDEEGRKVDLRRSHERVFGLSSDQVLTSRYFGLTTSRSPFVEERLRALAVRSSEGDGDAADDAAEEYMRILAEGFN